MFACIYYQKIRGEVSLTDFAYAFSPLIEEITADTVVLDVEGCELLFGSAYELGDEMVSRAARPNSAGGLGGRINVAIAANPDAAILAARSFKGLTFIAPGEELTCLGELPIEALCPESVSKSKVQSPKSKTQSLDFGHWTLDVKRWQEILETFKLWGIRTFRDLAELPTAGLSERLGQAGVKLQQLACGKTDRQLKLVQTAPVFENSIELEHPLTELEPLSFLLARLLNQLCAKLNAYALATNELQVQLKLENRISHDRRLTLPYAMRDHKVFLKLLLLDTEAHPPPAAVIAVSIACEPVQPRVVQNGLFIPLAPEPEKLELTLARLIKLVGTENVGSAQLLDTHRPDAFQVKRFVLKGKVAQRNRRVSKSQPSVISNSQCLLGFRVFRPPLRALVEAAKGYPTQINAWSADRSVHGSIVRLAGPWRTTGDWWRTDRWARDEWDVMIESRSANGGHTGDPLQILYRIYREVTNGSWFVEGVYD